MRNNLGSSDQLIEDVKKVMASKKKKPDGKKPPKGAPKSDKDFDDDKDSDGKTPDKSGSNPEIVINPDIDDNKKTIRAEGFLAKAAARGAFAIGHALGGTGPLGKTTFKGRAKYAADDSKKAKALKEAMGYKPMNPLKHPDEMSADEHLDHIHKHAAAARKFGSDTLFGKMHARHAGRHLHYFLGKDTSAAGAHKALAALKEEYSDVFDEGISKFADAMKEKEKADAKKKKKKTAEHDPQKGFVGRFDEETEMELKELSIGTLKGYADKAKQSSIALRAKSQEHQKNSMGSGTFDRATGKITTIKASSPEEGAKSVKTGAKSSNREFHTSRANAKIAAKKKAGIKEETLDEAKRGRPRKVQDAESNEHINMQLRKVISLRGAYKVKFGDGSSHDISPTVAHRALHQHDTMRTTIEKGEYAKRLAHSHASFSDAVAGKPAPAKKPKITLSPGFGHKLLRKH